MFYRIAEITLSSPFRLPSFANFACEAMDADITLETTQEDPPAGAQEIDCTVFSVRKIQDGWFFHFAENNHWGMWVGSDYTLLRLMQSEEPIDLSIVEWFVRIALECLLARKGYVSFHAACVALEGGAIAFTGPSGMGKSTRAKAWIDTLGARLISGDRPLIRVSDAYIFGVPWDGKEQCFNNISIPLTAICEVRRSVSSSIRNLTFSQRRRLLLNQCFMPMWDNDTATVQFLNITRLASQARIVRCFCGKESEDAIAVKHLLNERLESKEAMDMKAKTGFALRKLMGEYVLMPINENVSYFKASIIMNSVSSFIWEKLQNPISRDDLLTAVLDEYQVDEETAARDLDAVLDKLRDYGVIEEE